MANLKNIIRTCIICRKKMLQKDLIRFKCVDKKIKKFDNTGRSFYICEECIKLFKEDMKTKDLKRIEKLLNKECKGVGNYPAQLKEILINVR